MSAIRGKNLILRSLCLLVIGVLGFNLCACEKKESITSGTIFTSVGTDPFSVSARIDELRCEAEEDILFYLDDYNSEWYADEGNREVRSDLGGSRLIGISKYQYLGYCFFDWGESSESPVYYIFQVSAIDSTGEETITRDFYLISRKDFYKYHNSPGASVYGSEQIGFSSCSVDGFTTLDHAIAKIKEERGRDDISEELHLEQDDQFTVYDPMPLAYKNQVTVLFQEEDLVYALFMNGGNPDYASPVTLPQEWFKPEVLEKAEFGSILSVYYDGARLETYPLQIDPPYALTYAGRIAESEEAALKKAEQDLRDFCTGEK